MKKHLKKLLTLTVALIVVLSAVPVSAKTVTNVTPRQNVYVQPHISHGIPVASFHPRQKAKFSYNQKLGTIKSYNKDFYGYYFYAFYPKKTGKTTIVTTSLNRYGTSDKTFTEVDKHPFTILSYQNPVSSIKLGTHTISGSRFSKTDMVYTNYNLFSKKTQTLKVTPKKGWVVAGIDVINAKGKFTKGLCHNGPDKKYINKSVSAKFRATGGKKQYNLLIQFYNPKTGANIYSQVVFK